MYTLLNAKQDTRRLLNDTSENVWKSADIEVFINEAIKLIRKAIPDYFTDLLEIDLNDSNKDTAEIKLDADYTNLIPLFVSARCFDQDEQFYRSTSKMNEFETRKEEMRDEILASQAYIDKVTQNGTVDLDTEYVKDEYYNPTGTTEIITDVTKLG